MNGLLGKKKGMTEIFTAQGEAVPVTVIEAGPCVVVQRKSAAAEGYDAVQLGFVPVDPKRLSKPLAGHAGKGKGFRHLREFRVGADFGGKPGDAITAEIFQAGERVQVSGISKGKGFQGVIKRHGKAGGPASHGSRFHRTTGSIGQRTSPGEVFKNMKLPGHLGSERVTVRNLEVVEVRGNLVFVRGSVPGSNDGLLELRKYGA